MIDKKRGILAFAVMIAIFLSGIALAEDSFMKEVRVKAGSMDPSIVSTSSGNGVVFKVYDKDNLHRIACYNQVGRRVFYSEEIGDSQSIEVFFYAEGRYTCADAAVGSNMMVKVSDVNLVGNAFVDMDTVNQETPMLLILVIIIIAGIVIYLRRGRDLKEQRKKSELSR